MPRQLILYSAAALLLIAVTPVSAQSYGRGYSSGHGYSSRSTGTRGSSRSGSYRAPTATHPRSYHSPSASASTHETKGAPLVGKSDPHLRHQRRIVTAAPGGTPGGSSSGGPSTSPGGVTTGTGGTPQVSDNTPSGTSNSRGSSSTTGRFGNRSSSGSTTTAANKTTLRATSIEPRSADGSQAQDANGLLLSNDTTNGALPDSNTGEQVEAGTRGGKSRTGATGYNMPTCMAAWDPQTHIGRVRWREICARTLVSPHI